MFRKAVITGIALALISGEAFGAVEQKLEAAATAGKVAFVLVYDATAGQLEQAREMTSEAVKRVPGSVTIEVNRGDAVNTDFVTKYKLGTAPVPLILVSSSAGVITGGVVAAQANVERLVKLVPSPKKAEIIKALSSGNAVFITASRKGMATTATVNNACAVACQQMAGKSVQVNVDMDDPEEVGFLNEMRVDLRSQEPVTLVANPQGQIAGMYTGAMQVSDLVTAATKKVGGCCPSTVANPNASCAPGK